MQMGASDSWIRFMNVIPFPAFIGAPVWSKVRPKKK